MSNDRPLPPAQSPLDTSAADALRADALDWQSPVHSTDQANGRKDGSPPPARPTDQPAARPDKCIASRSQQLDSCHRPRCFSGWGRRWRCKQSEEKIGGACCQNGRIFSIFCCAGDLSQRPLSTLQKAETATMLARVMRSRQRLTAF